MPEDVLRPSETPPKLVWKWSATATAVGLVLALLTWIPGFQGLFSSAWLQFGFVIALALVAVVIIFVMTNADPYRRRAEWVQQWREYGTSLEHKLQRTQESEEIQRKQVQALTRLAQPYMRLSNRFLVTNASRDSEQWTIEVEHTRPEVLLPFQQDFALISGDRVLVVNGQPARLLQGLHDAILGEFEVVEVRGSSCLARAVWIARHDVWSQLANRTVLDMSEGVATAVAYRSAIVEIEEQPHE